MLHALVIAEQAGSAIWLDSEASSAIRLAEEGI
jgi:hypothetical protein